MPVPIVAGAIIAAKVVGPIVARWGVTKVFTKLSSPKEWNDFDLFLKDSVRAFANDPSMNQKYGWDKEIGSTHPLKLLYKPQGNEYLPVNIAKEYLEHWKKNWTTKTDKWARNRRVFIDKVWADLKKYIKEFDRQINNYVSQTATSSASGQLNLPGSSPLNQIQPGVVGSSNVSVSAAGINPMIIIGLIAAAGVSIFIFRK
jgi:hypothetical protein